MTSRTWEPEGLDELLLDQDPGLAGFRLERLELFNWGTFDRSVTVLPLGGRTSLLTGDIGSGKSTVVDAITTLLLPAQAITFNRAAGAEGKERTLRSYVQGHYRTSRTESGESTRPVALRPAGTYTVILAVFRNRGLGATVTLAQVLWQSRDTGQPNRFYAVAGRDMTIEADLAGFGSDVLDLKRRLRRAGVEVFDAFGAYAGTFRRLLGITGEQALNLFYQTVSMKSVGNLTQFVREHMLDRAAVADQIRDLIHHFDDLDRAHSAVQTAKAQIAALTPLCDEARRHAGLSTQATREREVRDALGPWFVEARRRLWTEHLESLRTALTAARHTRVRLDEDLHGAQQDEADARAALAGNGGNELDRLDEEARRLEAELAERRSKARTFADLLSALDLAPVADVDDFVARRGEIERLESDGAAHVAELDTRRTDLEVAVRDTEKEERTLRQEITSLRARTTLIPSEHLALRRHLCSELQLPVTDLPFVGELLTVKDAERAWEGAIERTLRSFALSLVVPEEHYARVSDWVDRTHLGARLVYLRVGTETRPPTGTPARDSLVTKVHVKPGAAAGRWLERRLLERFDLPCCTDLAEFRRLPRALSIHGQIKGSQERHEKDDRFRLDDRSRYVLGWDNQAKITALVARADAVAQEAQRTRAERDAVAGRLGALARRSNAVAQALLFTDFAEIDARRVAVRLDDVRRRRAELEAASDVLRDLAERLEVARARGREAQAARDAVVGRVGELEGAVVVAETLLADLGPPPEAEPPAFATIAARLAADGVEVTRRNADAREREQRERLTDAIDVLDHRVKRSGEKVVALMSDFRSTYPEQTTEMDSSLEAAGEYEAFLGRLVSDDLPRFETRFKHMLNENTINEVVRLAAQLDRQREDIRRRIDQINSSLHGMDYNPGRFIRLEAEPTTDADVREFRQDLRDCTAGSTTGDRSEQYSEERFHRVAALVARFRGREGRTDLDRRWTERVTDVRTWFRFSASERWRETDDEHEHYSDSGGKSGGQKEKLAYTILGASLAYQFGLEPGVTRSRTFRFVVIDEAFGRGSDESARYGLELFSRLDLQLLVVTPLQKIHVIEPYVHAVGYVANPTETRSLLRTMTISEYRELRDAARSDGAR